MKISIGEEVTVPPVHNDNPLSKRERGQWRTGKVVSFWGERVSQALVDFGLYKESFTVRDLKAYKVILMKKAV